MAQEILRLQRFLKSLIDNYSLPEALLEQIKEIAMANPDEEWDESFDICANSGAPVGSLFRQGRLAASEEDDVLYSSRVLGSELSDLNSCLYREALGAPGGDETHSKFRSVIPSLNLSKIRRETEEEDEYEEEEVE